MTDREFLDLEIDRLSEAEARKTGLGILGELVPQLREGALRNGGILAALLAAAVIAGMDNIPAYAAMGAAAVMWTRFFESLHSFRGARRLLRQFEENTYPDGYRAFLHELQGHAMQKAAQLKTRPKKEKDRLDSADPPLL